MERKDKGFSFWLSSFFSKRKRSGQTVVFEQVLLFTVGVAIFLAAFAVFTIAQGFYQDTAAADQVRQVRELVASELQAMAAGGNATNRSVELEVPRHIQDEVYQIVLTQRGLNVSVPGMRLWSFSTLGWLNQTFNLSGARSSNSALVVIEKELGHLRIA